MLSVSLRSQSLRYLLFSVVMALTILVIAGCNSGDEAEEPNILHSFPVEWTPLTVESTARWQLIPSTSLWQPVNIDGDQDVEYLVFYTYDNSANGATDGPVGALIYDFQDTSEFVVGQPSLPIPLQPSGNFAPYRLLPSYWEGLDGAFIGQSASATPRLVIPARRASSDDGLIAPSDSGVGNELVLTGGNTVLTFVWWRNIFDGYGATQIRGPGGFRDVIRAGNSQGETLESWASSSNPTEIKQVDALYPIYGAVRPDGRPSTKRTADIGRSTLCHVIRYIRESVDSQPSSVSGGAYQSDIAYKASPQGIHFCRFTLSHPFYPEGVVVKYMHISDNDDARKELMLSTLEDFQQQDILNATDFDPTIEWIANIETRTNIDYPESFRTSHPPDIPATDQPTLVDTRQLMTQVCVEIQPNVLGESEHKLLYFSLINEPPSTINDDTQRSSDRLWITYLEDATNWGAEDCTQLVMLNAYPDSTPLK